jgi:hypothetical protein
MPQVAKCPQQLRKELLVAESEINRTLFIGEYRALAEGVRDVAEPAKQFGRLAALMAAILGVYRLAAAGRTSDQAPGQKRPSMFGAMLRLLLAGWLEGRRAAR